MIQSQIREELLKTIKNNILQKLQLSGKQLKELQETDTSGYSQKQLEKHELNIKSAESTIKAAFPYVEVKKRTNILKEQDIDLGNKKVSEQSDGLLDKYSKAEQQYLNNEALNKYIKNTRNGDKIFFKHLNFTIPFVQYLF